MICKIYALNELQDYKYVVILSEYRGRILLSRHKARTTWETQGGHIEPGETPLAAAKRELYEESGAVRYEIEPLCDYWAGDENTNQGAGGMVFTAKLQELAPMPECEMAEIRTFEQLPENLTYPGITPVLFARAARERQSALCAGERMEAKRLLFGTGNPAKLSAMQRRLAELNVEIIGLKELNAEIPEVIEDGRTPLENAEKKARSYYEAFRIPVFSCDSGLYIDGIPEELQPGVHVRTIDGKYLSDEEMLSYYSELVRRYGAVSETRTGQKTLRARYRNAICLVLDENHIYSSMDERMASEEFLIAEKSPYNIKKKGFPLDSLSIDIETGDYYYNRPEAELDQMAVKDGVLEFFRKYL